MENKILNHYKFTYDGEYITGFYDVLPELPYDFYGQMADYPEVSESLHYGGWYKFIDGGFVEDTERKAEMIAKKERESSWEEKMEAQVTYTAMMTDTLIEEE